jgi:hypothetical protein
MSENSGSVTDRLDSAVRLFPLPLRDRQILAKARSRELICPRCEAQPLTGEELVSEVYQGVLLTCPDSQCGFSEL